ncbi:glycosyltransferase [Streptomyces sp. NPDC015345]|uniref:glycosyltransferase n=1 Tax=Streptomyces sp. NPDC015345 TaxID=3364953 RepID=UPI0037013DB9
MTSSLGPFDPGADGTPARPGTFSAGPVGPGRLSIALVSEHASPLAALGGVDAGGQNVHVACLAGALADRGHRVTVYTRRDARDLPERVPLRDGVEVHHVPAGPPEQIPKDELLPHMGAFGRYLARAWRGRPPDLVHSHFWMSGLASLWATRELGLPLLHTYHALGTVKRRHQQLADPSPPQRIALETEVGFGCDRVIATCRDEVVELGRMGIPASKAGVVPCGVDTELFTPRGPVAERGTERYQLLQLGRLVPRKGAAVSIAALALLPETELVVVGGPPADRLDQDPEVKRLRALAREAGVADRVRFTGGVPSTDVPPLLRAADVVLCPADYEPFGIVPLEAMACGRPVVASAVGGQLDTVADPATGRLVPPRDPEALAAAVAELLADPAAREACGEAGRRRTLRRFGWGRVAAATEAAYCDVLDTQYVATGAGVV